ncbi:hypothetical protein EVAR_4513_1 [Eumeta japonica]|uniref:Regulatory protein zeste n=1 Tax=Eumeta variegata TaxID=151549 RepID=A0A4C1SVY2_EUMVA|nr:hypothetical protein EVAR_4513_1 [Eumeta japonica]
MAVFNNERVTTEQLERLIDFLENNEDLALGHCRTKEGRQRNKKLWDEVALLLNSLGNGATKDGALWSKYWSDYKNRLKNKIRSLSAAAQKTGGAPLLLKFTPLEERCRRILGMDAGCPISGVQINPFQCQISQPAQSGSGVIETAAPMSPLVEPVVVAIPTIELTPPQNCPQASPRPIENAIPSSSRRRGVRRERSMC